jgi:N-acetyl-1-D-myo-inositol-2-amino-2-deoxy-alpha-D-glucopyranoside deacetylase
MRAFGQAGGLVRKMYANTVPKSVLAGMVERMRGGDPEEHPAGGTGFAQVQSADELPFGVPDEVVTTEVDAAAYLGAKLNAMRAHATQISVDSPFYALSNNLGVRAFGVEYYILLAGERGPAGSDGREADLFAGID